jgi:hypothetical protein
MWSAGGIEGDGGAPASGLLSAYTTREQARMELPPLPHGTHYLVVACFWPGFVSASGQ